MNFRFQNLCALNAPDRSGLLLDGERGGGDGRVHHGRDDAESRSRVRRQEHPLSSQAVQDGHGTGTSVRVRPVIFVPSAHTYGSSAFRLKSFHPTDQANLRTFVSHVTLPDFAMSARTASSSVGPLHAVGRGRQSVRGGARRRTGRQQGPNHPEGDDQVPRNQGVRAVCGERVRGRQQTVSASQKMSRK